VLTTPDTTPSDTGTVAVHELLRRLVETWNAGDPTAYAALFSKDADYTTYFGLTMAGRQEIEDGHRFLFNGPGRGSQLSWGETPRIRFVRPEVAIVLVGGGTSMPEDVTPDRNSQSTLTLIVAREQEGWQIASFQNTRRAPRPGAPE
jgi:uncharacterized protein (TIGR02246 family)